MSVLDVRRHAERADVGDSKSGLSAAGRAMCERLAKSAPRYALVASSPLPRARETAERIAGRLDAVDPGLLPDLGGPASRLFAREPRQLDDWAALLREEADARRFADEQLPTWARLAGRVGDRDLVLAVSHGGIIELPALLLAGRLGARLDGQAFAYGEGVRVTYTAGAATKIEVLRV